MTTLSRADAIKRYPSCNHSAWRILIIQASCLALSLLAVVLTHGTPWMFAACVVLGYFLARNLELGHGLMHGTFFESKRTALTRGIGAALTAPFLFSWSQWRYTHYHHHKDPRIEGFDYPDVRGIRGFFRLIVHHLMVNHWANSLRRMVFSVFRPSAIKGELFDLVHRTSEPRPGVVRDVTQEYRIVFALLCLLAAAVALFGVEAVLVPWLATMFAASIIHVVIELPEHVLCDLDSPDPKENSFEILNNRLMDVFTFHNTRHATHHRYPEVPVYHLVRLSADLTDTPVYNRGRYRDFWRRFLTERILKPAA